MSTSSSLRQQFGAFCTNVPLGVRTLLEAPGLTTTLTAPKTALCVCPPLGNRFSSTGSTVGGVLKKRRSRRLVCVHPWTKGFLRPLQSGRGHGSCFPSHANEAMGFSRKGMWTHIPVPATETVFHAVTLLLHFLIHGSSRYHPKTGFPPLPSAADVQPRFCR